jgi:hypothetical protein
MHDVVLTVAYFLTIHSAIQTLVEIGRHAAKMME